MRLGGRRTPNSEPRPERESERGKNRGSYHPLREQSKFMIPKNQCVPDVAQGSLPFVYAAAQVICGSGLQDC